MPKQDDLFALITSLGSNERRRLTLHAGLNKSGDNNYFKLYQLYLEMEEHSVEYLINEYTKLYPNLNLKECKKRLADHKIHLFEIILKVMRFHYSSHSAEVSIRELIQDANFLMDRNLYEKGFKYIQKAKKKAIEFGYSSFLINILKTERNVLKEWGKKGYGEAVLALLEQEKQIRKEIELDGRLWEISDQLFLMVRKKARLYDESEKKRVREILAHPLLNAEVPQNFQTARNYHFSRAMGFQLLKEFDKAWIEYKSIVELFESHPHQIKEATLQYQMAINNYLNACHLNQVYQDFPHYLEVLKKYPGHSPDSKAESFQNYTFLALLYGLNKPDVQMALDLVPVIEAGLVTHASKINPSRVLGFCINITLLAFVTGDLSLARNWNNRVLDYQKTGLREDAIFFSLLIYLVINAEQKLEGLYEDCRKVRQKLKPQKGSLGDLVITFLSKIAVDGGIGPKTDWETFLDQMEKVENKSGTAYAEMLIWAKSKQTGRPMMDFI